MGGLILSVVGFLSSGFIIPLLWPTFSSSNLSQFVSLTAVLIGLFAGALVYRRIYDYVNHQKQIRDWRRDYALSLVKDIYAPLYDETSSLADRVAKFDSFVQHSSDGAFLQLIKSYRRLFVDYEVTTALVYFVSSLGSYSDKARDVFDSTHNSIPEAFHRVTGHTETEPGCANLMHVFGNEHKLFLDAPILKEIHDWHRDRFVEAHRKVEVLAGRNPAEDFEEILRIVKDKHAESIQAFEMVHSAASQDGETAVNRLAQIIKDPSIIRLDFRVF